MISYIAVFLACVFIVLITAERTSKWPMWVQAAFYGGMGFIVGLFNHVGS